MLGGLSLEPAQSTDFGLSDADESKASSVEDAPSLELTATSVETSAETNDESSEALSDKKSAQGEDSPTTSGPEEEDTFDFLLDEFGNEDIDSDFEFDSEDNALGDLVITSDEPASDLESDSSTATESEPEQASGNEPGGTADDTPDDANGDGLDDFAGLLDDAMSEAGGDGADSLDDMLAAAEAAQDQPSTETTQDDALDNLRFHDNMEATNELEDLLGEVKKPQPKTNEYTANLSELVSGDFSDIAPPSDDEYTEDDDESWALGLLEGSNTSQTGTDLPDPDLDSIAEFERGGEFSFTDLHQQQRQTPQDDEPYVDDYVDDYVDEYVDDTQDDAAHEEIHFNELPPHDALNDLSDSATDNTMTLGGNLDSNNEVKLDVPQAALDPIEFRKEAQARRMNWLWGLLALLLIVVAALQTAWFRLDTWSRDATFRPYYAQACAMIGCELPGIQDVTRIRASNTVFNPHRSEADVLVVDTLLTNAAEHPQPYPDVELEFRDLNDRIVAQRTFSPSEYLAGDVLPGDQMPPGVPVHIAIEVVNPGPEAVSRRVFIRGNQ